MATSFEKQHPEIEVVLNLAGSQQLAQQLVLGAPADVFASANEPQMQVAISGGRIVSGAPVPFARNRLVVVAPVSNPASLNRLQDLAKPGLHLVLADDAVPVGRYARRFLENASRDAAFDPSYGQTVLANVTSFELNVRSALTKVALGEADAGIVYTSDLAGAGARQVVRLDIPDALNAVAVYPIAPVADSAHPELAAAFIAFVCSAVGQAILARYGFDTGGAS
jgi:molybdate transport system substrate-binding protein